MKCNRAYYGAGLCLCLIVLLAGVRLEAQAVRATISGSVTDTSGAALPGATVQVRNSETGVVHTFTTDSRGRYSAPDLQVGTYDVSAEMQGFKKTVHSGVNLSVGSQAVVDFQLPVGQVQETVTVESQVTQVDTSSASIGSTVDPVQMRELPLNGRNFEQLLTLAPGVQQTAATGGAFYGGGQNYSVAGSRPEGQAFLLDDTNISNFWNHGTGSGAAGTSLGVEAISEFQTLTNTYSAQFGGNGAVITAVSHSGSNSLHGSVYEFLRNSALDARNYFDSLEGPPPFRRNQFGASLGGPIKKDKAFFYVNYEGLRQVLAETKIANVPDANAHRGLLPLPCGAGQKYACDPATGLANVGVAPSIASTLAIYPVATTPGKGGIGTIAQVASDIASENYILGRVDYNLSASDSLFGRYVSDRADFTAPFVSSNIPLWPASEKTANQYFTLEERHATQTKVNVARFSFVRPVETGVITGSVAPLQFFPGSGREDGTVSVAGLTTIGASSTLPFQLVPNRFTVGDDIYWTHGAHNLKFGMELTRVQDNTNAPFRIGGAWTFNSLEDFLLGKAFQLNGALPGNADAFRDLRELWLNPYFQDDWKVSSRLTLNLGLRYSWAANPTERQNKLFAITDPPNGTGFSPVSHVFQSNPSTWNLDPRIGFAYDLFGDHKTSIRGGFGTFHNVIQARTILPAFWLVPPFAIGNQQFPNYPIPFVGSGVSAPKPTTTQGLDYRTDTTPYMMQWNLNVQRDIAGTVVTVGYVGSRGVHLVTMTDLNPPHFTLNAGGQKVFDSKNRINNVFGPLQTKETNGSSNYNSLQLTADHSFTHNVQFHASYTFSKSLDYGSQTYGLEGTTATTQQIEDPYDISIDRGRSAFDRTHMFRASTVVVLPFRGNRAVQGWQLSGIFSANSGPPLTAFVGFDNAGLGVGNTQRPNLVPGFSNNPIVGRVDKWFDPAAFSVPAPGTYGNLGRDTIIGPGLWDFDFSLAKNTPITERLSAQFRAEFFNIFNHTNFDIPVNSVFVNSGGVTRVNPNAGQIQATAPGTTSRQMQFALKLVF